MGDWYLFSGDTRGFFGETFSEKPFVKFFSFFDNKSFFLLMRFFMLFCLVKRQVLFAHIEMQRLCLRQMQVSADVTDARMP